MTTTAATQNAAGALKALALKSRLAPAPETAPGSTPAGFLVVVILIIELNLLQTRLPKHGLGLVAHGRRDVDDEPLQIIDEDLNKRIIAVRPRGDRTIFQQNRLERRPPFGELLTGDRVLADELVRGAIGVAGSDFQDGHHLFRHPK